MDVRRTIKSRNFSRASRPLFGMRNLFLVGILLAFGYWWVMSVGSMSVNVERVTIEAGDTIRDVPKRAALDVSSWRFRLWARLVLGSPSLFAGTYSVSDNTTVSTLFSRVLATSANEWVGMNANESRSDEVSITILPGWNIWDIDQAFATAGITPAQAFSAPSSALLSAAAKRYTWFSANTKGLEGFLYPDTYRFLKNTPTQAVVFRLMDRFDAQMAKPFFENNPQASVPNFIRTLIIASLIEREEPVSTNRPITAGVIEGRLAEGEILGIDATVCTDLELSTRACTPAIIGRNIFNDTPYNTRKRRGLPPWPIASPSISAFEAAMNPANTPYRYYLHDGSGQVHYARTLAEHNANKNQYLR